jgi:subtilisin family serine protease
MRALVAAAVLALAVIAGGREPVLAQSFGPSPGAGTVAGHAAGALTPLGGAVIGSVAAAAVAPMIGSIVAGRELTTSEVWHIELSLFLGPVGWWVADRMFPPGRTPPPTGQPGRGGNVSVPPLGATDFAANEVLVEFRRGLSAPRAALVARRLQLTEIERQNFALTRRTLVRFRIDGGGSVRGTLLAMRGLAGVAAAQPNHFFVGTQAQSATAPAEPSQYVVGKMHLLEAHRVTSGDDVLVAVIDSQVDMNHPDLAGAFAGSYDAVGGPATPHMHGTALAGAIAAHRKLIGVAPKVRLLAVRSFSGTSADSAQGTTFDIMKGIDWAAAQNARVLNMSFAGPADAMMADMLAKAYARGMVLIAAVGNAGPKSPPLYPAGYAQVIGVTATDAADRLLAVANRGPQVAIAAPGVDIIAPAPDGRYQITSGTSIATADASGVAALLLARDPKLSPAALRRDLIRAARAVPGTRREVGAGVIDALAAVNEIRK